MTVRPNRRTVLRWSAGAALAPLWVACGSAPPPTYQVGAAEKGGFFYEFTQSLVDATARADLDFRLERLVTSGSLQNLSFVRDGTLPLAIAFADAAVADPSGVTALSRIYENYLQVAVVADGPIADVADLRGRRVSLGPVGSGLANSAERILAAADIPVAALTQVPTALVDLLDALGDGRVEAGFFGGGVPNPVMDSSTGRGPASGIRILNLSAPLVRLQDEYGSVYQPVTVPAGVYGSDEEVQTVGVTSLVVASPTLPDEVAGALVDLMLTRPEELVPPAALGTQYLSPSALPFTFGIPLHPGAAQAYREHHG